MCADVETPPKPTGAGATAQQPMPLTADASRVATSPAESSPNLPISQPMPPARDPIFAPSRESSTRNRQRRSEMKPPRSLSLGLISILFMAGAFVEFALFGLLGHSPEWRLMAGLIAFLSIPTVVGSQILAVIALIRCLKDPKRYPRGQTPAIVTLTAGCTLIILFTIATVYHRSKVRAGASGSGQPTEYAPRQ